MSYFVYIYYCQSAREAFKKVATVCQEAFVDTDHGEWSYWVDRLLWGVGLWGSFRKCLSGEFSKYIMRGYFVIVGREVIEEVLVTTVKVHGGNVTSCELLTRCLRKF